MKTFTFLIAVFTFHFSLFTFHSLAQNYNPFKIGSQLNDRGYSIAVDASSNMYVTGTFSGTADFNPDPAITNSMTATSTGGDIFIAKYNSSFQYQRAFHIGAASSNMSCGYDIAVDASFNIYVIGSFFGTNVNFNPLGATKPLSSNGNRDIFVAKYNSSGICQWAFNVGGAMDYDYGYSIAVDAGSVYVTGGFRGTTVNFNPLGTTKNLSSSAFVDIFVAKYTSAGGVCQWAFNVRTTIDLNAGNSIAVDANSNVYVTGYFTTNALVPAKFDPKSNAGNLYSTPDKPNIFVAKYNSAGAYQWAFKVGGTSDGQGYGIAVNNTGVYVTGYFSGTADFDPSAATYSLTPSNADAFVAKYTSAGTFRWAFKIGSSDLDESFSIAVDANYVYVTGDFVGTTGSNPDFNPGTGEVFLPITNGRDIFVAKYTLDGKYGCAFSMVSTTTSPDYGTSIAVNAENMYVTGYFSGTADFDPNANTTNLIPTVGAASNYDIYVAKYDNGCSLIGCTVPGVNAGKDLAICAGSSTIISVTTKGGNPPYTYQWSPTAGLNNSTISNPVAAPTTTTTYTVLVTDNARCTGTDMVTITVNPQPTITITGITTICNGSSTILTASSGATYLWATSGQTTASIRVNPTTTTTYTVTGTDANKCANTNTVSVTVNSIPSNPGQITGPKLVCANSTHTYSINTVPYATSYKWIIPPGAIINSGQGTTTINITFGNNSGTGDGFVIAENSCGSSDASKMQVTVKPLPSVNISSPKSIICQGETVTLTATSTGVSVIYNWAPSLGLNTTTEAIVTASPAVTTTYTVTSTGISTCAGTATVTINVSNIKIDAGSDITICPGFTAHLNVTTTGDVDDVSYLWSPNKKLNNDTVLSPSANPDSTITYYIVVQNKDGCRDKDSITLYVILSLECVLNIYNGITPNGDGNNDVWWIDGIQSFPDNKVLIFNRWGDEVWSGKGYDNKNVVWKGLYKGKHLPDGTYYYVIDLFWNDKKKTYTGWVEVTR
ncbi:MAG: gliding motility-associated C-terminal domain-containing protein [Bacteroidota bacterium]